MSVANYYVHRYHPTGHLVYQKSGRAGKICADDLNKTVTADQMESALNDLGESTCRSLDYRLGTYCL